jgi:hypothetical protein
VRFFPQQNLSPETFLRNTRNISQKRRGKVGKMEENRYFCVGKMEIFGQKAIEKRNKYA